MNHDRYNVPAAQKAPSRPGWGLGCGPGQSRAATPRGLQSFQAPNHYGYHLSHSLVVQRRQDFYTSFVQAYSRMASGLFLLVSRKDSATSCFIP